MRISGWFHFVGLCLAVLGAGAAEQAAPESSTYWAFRPIERPAVPWARRVEWLANPVDAFVLSQLEQRGLQPNALATKRELVRRLYFDLLGLPPPPEAVAAFEADTREDSYARLVDQLLSQPAYGERWARHWLDVARFAQSNGYERDGEKPYAWRYRDYVIKAFNEDKPYDRFVLEQIAGDELPDAAGDAIIATGFQRLGVWDDEPDDKQLAEYDELDDILSTTGSAILGLTMGCARCHDHKFDPIPQRDYYQMLCFFRNVRPSESAKFNLESANYLPLARAGQIERWKADVQKRIEKLEQQASIAEDRKRVETEIQKIKAEPPPFEWALGVRERGPEPIATRVLARGNPATPGAPVEPVFPAALGGGTPEIQPGAFTTGRRLAFARWIASPKNPLTARVIVNRVWRHHFGKGLVRTTTDFGRAGARPTHPALLDWLAMELIDSGWSLKKLHKVILLSNTYRQSSRVENSKAEAIDPENDWLWRQNLRRLESEPLRDAILAISGGLNARMGGRGFFPRLAAEVLAGQSRPGLDWVKSSKAEQSRRSVYAYVRRTMLAPMFEAFDYSNTTTPLGERPVTTVAPQALMLLNDRFVQDQAELFARRLRREAGSGIEEQVSRGYALALGRNPTRDEARRAREFIERQTDLAEALRGRMSFHLEVPAALSVEYMKQLEPEDFLSGPREGWSFHRGRWSAAYEGIRAMDRSRGPFCLAREPTFLDATIECRVMLDPAAESGSILLRARADGDEQRGYEIVFEPKRSLVSLRRHARDAVELARAGAALASGEFFGVRLELAGPRVRLWLNGGKEADLDVIDPEPFLETGAFGVRAPAAALTLDQVVIRAEDKTTAIEDGGALAPGESGLVAFCLLLLNLNETIYVD